MERFDYTLFSAGKTSLYAITNRFHLWNYRISQNAESVQFRSYYRKGAPFNGIRDCSQRERRMDSGVRGTQHASRRGTPWGVKPVDNGPTSASHTADERATPAI